MATRIYADFNGLVRGVINPDRTAVVLDTFGSLRDLSNAGVVLIPGLPLIAVDQSDNKEDLEGHGLAQYDHHRKRWIVEFDEVGIRYVPHLSDSGSRGFSCVRCRTPFPAQHPAAMLVDGLACANCGTPALEAYKPPAT